MASLRAPGIYRMYIQNTAGVRKPVKEANSAFWNVAGLGSPDGAISTTATPEKWNYLHPSNDQGVGGYSIIITYEASTATTVDASDCVGIIPVIVNGQVQTIGLPGGNGLGNANFTADLSLGDRAYVADTETDIAKIRAKEGVTFRVGGDKIFMSIEDNT